MTTKDRGVYPYSYERERALKAFAGHVMTIEHDEGVFRSIRFGRPGSSAYHFRLVTWPGHLAISGDIADYIFARTHDMFEFFGKGDGPDDWAQMPLEINPHYWAQKCTASAARCGNANGGTPGVSSKTLDLEAVKRDAVEFFRNSQDRWAPKPRPAPSLRNLRLEAVSPYETYRVDAFRDFRHDVLDRLSDGDSIEHLFSVLSEWRPSTYMLRDHRWDNPFTDSLYEGGYTTESYDFGFLMCCYAVVWGIKRYAQHKTGRDAASFQAAVLRGVA